MSSRSRQLPSWMAQKFWNSILFARYRQYTGKSPATSVRRSYVSWTNHLQSSLHSRAFTHSIRPSTILHTGRFNYPALPIVPAQHLHNSSVNSLLSESTSAQNSQRPNRLLNIRHQRPVIDNSRRWFHATRQLSNSQKEQAAPDLQLSVIDYLGDKSLKKPKPTYIFTHAATGFPKAGKRTVLPPQNEEYASTQVGEDAYFRRYDSLGVADGVGGWTGTSGANPALYARKLMHYAYLELERFDNIDDPSFYDYDKADPVDILQKSYEHCLEDAKNEDIVGSSTACLVILRNDELRIANIGDCGVSIIRHNNYVFRTEEQQHSFNFPVQLGTGSPDTPSDAQRFKVTVEKGDIVILASDGLFDNLFDEDILDIVRHHVAAHTVQSAKVSGPRTVNIEPQTISDALAKRAKLVSEDSRNINSPFQTRAIQEGLYYQGGKTDDISVLVAIVKDSEDSPDRRL
ncbi:hypothetical protein NQZ79_g156 [Umbelopsis isabellina]|nr:hypothetical protein NQZ79_g156 [Umbelopsis isabellina]